MTTSGHHAKDHYQTELTMTNSATLRRLKLNARIDPSVALLGAHWDRSPKKPLDHGVLDRLRKLPPLHLPSGADHRCSQTTRSDRHLSRAHGRLRLWP